MSKYNGGDTLHDFDLYRHHATDRSIKVSKTNENSAGFWLPFSEVEVKPLRGNEVKVTVPEWLAVEKGLL